jgi:polar amino acid transport system substrate-binding protein
LSHDYLLLLANVNNVGKRSGLINLAMLKIMMKIIYLFLIFGLVATSAWAKDYKLTTGDHQPPYTGLDLPHRGMLTEIIDVVFKEMGHNCTIDFLPWKRGYDGAKRGLYSGTFPYIDNEERQKDFYYSDPIYNGRVQIFVRKGSQLEYRSEEDLKGLTICLPLGYSVNKKILPLLERNEVKQINPETIESCFKLIEFERADFVVINETQAKYTIQKISSSEKITKLGKMLDEFNYHFIVSKADPDGENLILEFNQALNRVRKNGWFNEIIQRHFSLTDMQ